MRTLRSRLIISHTLPLLVVIPLIAATILYILETQVLLRDVENELVNQAALIANATANDPTIWENDESAQDFIDRLSNGIDGDVTLLDPQGHPLASNNPDQPTGIVRVEVFEQHVITTNDPENDLEYNFIINANRTEILVPVRNANQELVGVVQLGGQVANIYQNFQRVRWLMIGVLVVELIIGAGIGLFLALRLERNLQHVTHAIHGVASGKRIETLPTRNTLQEFQEVLEAFNIMVVRLQESQDMRRQLLANLVHELGRPLGALRSAIRALMEGADQDTTFRQELLEGMDKHIQRLEPLLDNLAELHGVLLEAPPLQRQNTNVEVWLSDILTTWQIDAQQKGIDWELHIQPHLPAIHIDPRRMGQAVENLISNAIKYTPAAGKISIRAMHENRHFQLAVSDTGVGIAPDELPHIFEPFYRTGRRFPQGMGLGLAIAQNIVNAHGGQLTVESTPQEGSIFRIQIPL